MAQGYQFGNVLEMIDHYYGVSQEIRKADAPVTSATSGFLNKVYGSYAFSQLNMEGNAFAVLPKYPWQQSGFRAISAHPGSTADGRIGEGSSVPDATKPTIKEIDLTPKLVSHTFMASWIQDGLVNKSGDDAIGDMEFLRNYFAALHAMRINEQLLLDFDTIPTGSYGFESLDRVTASSVERAACGETAGDEDIYGIDRSANTWANATVSHNSGTDRNLKIKLITDLLGSLETAGAKTNLILTGSDTKWRIIELFNTSVRYNGELRYETVQLGINGVQTEQGGNFGSRVATVFNIPLVTSQGVKKDTISRMYFLDTTIDSMTGVPRLGISLLYPTQYFESGMNAPDANPLAINYFGTKGGYATSGEIVCTFFAAQGKLRDLK